MEVNSDFKSIKYALEESGIYSGLTSGFSMEPLIHHQKDTVIIKKVSGRLKKYDIAVYVTKFGKYIMHRVVKVYDDHYIFIGDNLLNKEYVTDDMVVGILDGFYKNGKKYIDLNTDKCYKFYSVVWTALLPLRPIYYYLNRIVKKLKKYIF
ncbi:MAG: S24/S26 family peptidase, partial [Clostridiales bacterium]|nr:S24/S26 family peptidase [Clostridiales bacterium]